jgi:hypothetical protein
MIDPRTAAQIKACQGVYSLSDTARHFGVGKASVHRIWNGETHGAVAPGDTPNVVSKRVPKDILIDDGQVLLQRGLSLNEAADTLGVSKTTLYMTLRENTYIFV